MHSASVGLLRYGRRWSCEKWGKASKDTFDQPKTKNTLHQVFIRLQATQTSQGKQRISQIVFQRRPKPPKEETHQSKAGPLAWGGSAGSKDPENGASCGGEELPIVYEHPGNISGERAEADLF
jgi:hypothetical protein